MLAVFDGLRWWGSKVSALGKTFLRGPDSYIFCAPLDFTFLTCQLTTIATFRPSTQARRRESLADTTVVPPAHGHHLVSAQSFFLCSLLSMMINQTITSESLTMKCQTSSSSTG